MNISETLKSVLGKFILSEFDAVESLSIQVYGGVFEVYFYEITYNFKSNIEYDRFIMRDIVDKTVTVYKMFGDKSGSDVGVLFSKV